MNIKKMIATAAALTFLVCSFPILARAADQAETAAMSSAQEQCSLTIQYPFEADGLENAEVRLHKVAALNPQGSLQYTDKYSGYPITQDPELTKRGMETLRDTLTGINDADQIVPDQTAKVSASGTASFQQLEAGLYLVEPITVEHDHTAWEFMSILIQLPQTAVDGQTVRQVTVNAKGEKKTETAQRYSIEKLWQDYGSSERPESITVDIYKDKQLYETVTLSGKNNWTYSWEAYGTAQWSVAEKNVPTGYTVSCEKQNNKFILTNSKEGYVTPPNTGDPFRPVVWILLLIGGGTALITSGILLKRSK